MLRAFAILGLIVVAAIAACPPPSTERACNADHDCFVGEHCADGFCAPDVTVDDAGSITDAGSIVDAGSRVDAGSHVDAGANDDAGANVDAGANDDAGTNVDAGANADAGASDGGTDAGSDAGFTDAGPSLCPLFDDTFADATEPPGLFYFSAPLCARSVGNGVYTSDLDVNANGDECGIGNTAPVDARSAVLSAHFDDAISDPHVQQYIAVDDNSGRSFLMMIQHGAGPTWVARIDDGAGPFDDVRANFSGTGPFEIQVAIEPNAIGGSHVTWLFDDGTGLVEVRSVDVTDDFSAADVRLIVQAFNTPLSDPPPVRATELALFTPCGG